MVENPASQGHVGTLSGNVDVVPAQRFHNEFENVDKAHTDRQNQQGIDDVIGNNPVVNGHDEKRRRQGKQVHEHGRQGDMAIDRPIARHDPPEPPPGTGIVS